MVLDNSYFLHCEFNFSETRNKFSFTWTAITEILENLSIKMYGAGNRFGFLISCLIVSCMFFLFARYGKNNKWIFLTGLIIYFFDSIIIIFSFRWPQMIFIFLAMWNMIPGLAQYIKR